MDTEREEHYLKWAMDNPDVICSEVPTEIFETASYSGDEPTKFLTDFFATGHTQWLAQKHGRRMQFSKDRINAAVIVLWIRACRLQTSHILGRRDPNWDKQLFSDEGLYD